MMKVCTHFVPLHVPATTRPQTQLLSAGQLLDAVQGHPGNDSAIARWACALGALYKKWIIDPHNGHCIHGQIGEVVGAIDAWISGQLPRPVPGSPRGTESIGGAIARFAEAWACADWTLYSNDDPVQRHRAWDHLAEISEGYDDLVRQIARGSIILPKSWPGIGWPGLASAGEQHTDIRHHG
ncbi:hypothetical protein [Nocardia testacea]|uniref:hypothetical protein n=1 Tax=Nocardia testacea TaxID=248551 RepID=UPI0012F6EA69|nr:hypothetical protein [Nocardia testacea]